jgi:hypothetical protein
MWTGQRLGGIARGGAFLDLKPRSGWKESSSLSLEREREREKVEGTERGRSARESSEGIQRARQWRRLVGNMVPCTLRAMAHRVRSRDPILGPEFEEPK